DNLVGVEVAMDTTWPRICNRRREPAASRKKLPDAPLPFGLKSCDNVQVFMQDSQLVGCGMTTVGRDPRFLCAHADDFVHRFYERPHKTLHVLSPVGVLVVTECQVEAALLHMRLQPQRVEGSYGSLWWEPRAGQILRPNKKGLPSIHLVHLAQVVNVDA